MKCDDIKLMLSTAADGELDPDLKAVVEDHLCTCNECRRWSQHLNYLSVLYQTREAPASLKNKILTAVSDKNKQIGENKKRSFLNKLFSAVPTLAGSHPARVGTAVAILILSFYVYIATPPPPIPERPVAKVDSLPAVGSFEKFKQLLAKIEKNRSAAGSEYSLMKSAPQSIGTTNEKALQSSNAGFSETNVQVQGVDEADIVKTDGRYIYQVNGRQIVIVDAYPPGNMRVVKKIEFDEKDLMPNEIYLDKNNLVVIGFSYEPMSVPDDRTSSLSPKFKNELTPEIYPYPGEFTRDTVKAVVYDITDKSRITKIREVELEGNYISSRKIGSSLYILANKYIDTYRILNDKKVPQTFIKPSYRDSAAPTEKFVEVDYKNIKYFPESEEPNYLLVGSLDLNQPDKQMHVATYMGSGQNVYASRDNLYAAVTSSRPKTTVYKFALKKGETEYRGKGEVLGTILNQFSMDESGEYFRIATTQDNIPVALTEPSKAGGRNENTSKNNIYVLDDSLKVVGKIENIAPGERIYSARFIGSRAYMVTFKQVDPFFVIDLSDPRNPEILGELKIPGYSNYLHPYDEDHIIGFGRDTTEKDGNAYSLGIKIAIFNVSNVKNPVEKFKTVIGDRGTESELLYNHKALLFDKEKNLMAFPVSVVWESSKKHPEWDSSEFIFQGAYVYNISPDKSLNLKGRVTHLSKEDKKSVEFRYGGGSLKNIQRILYIGDTLYTLSNAEVKANDLNNLEEIKGLTL